MIGLLVDSVVLFGIISFLQREFAPDFKDIVIVTFGLSIAIFVLLLFLAPAIGVLVVVPAALIVGFVLMYFCSLPLSHASIATVVYLGYKTGLMFLFAMV